MKNEELREKRYKTLDTDNKLIWNFRDIGHVIRSLSEGKGSQERILIVLGETGQITQKELTSRLEIKPGSASETISKLINSGYVCRVQSKNDKRTFNLKLTESGKKRAKELAEKRNARHVEMFSCMSDEERKNLLALTEKLNKNWKSKY